VFRIVDELHDSVHGEFDTLEAALTELECLAKGPPTDRSC
jgi:hypothetical protein